MSAILPEPQASVSLSDLPQHILDDIILMVHNTIKYDAYLCDLRLVSQLFNQSILYCLAFRASPRELHERHKISCTQHRGKIGGERCGRTVSCDATYARITLQGNLAIVRTRTPRLLKHYSTLNEALAILRTDLTVSTTSYALARSRMDSMAMFGQSLLPPILAEPHTIALCEEAVTLFRCTRRSWISLSCNPNEVTDRRPEFWLRLLACHLGDYELLHQYLFDTGGVPRYMKPTRTECNELLMMVAFRGHTSLFDQVLSHPTFKDVDLAFVLSGACHSNSTGIVNKVFDIVPSEAISNLCAHGLQGLQMLPPFRAVSNAAIERVVNRYDDTTDRGRLRHVLKILANVGAARSLRMLLDRSGNHRLWPWPRRDPLICFSPLWHACVNGDLDCVLALFEGGYIKRPNSDSTLSLLSICMLAAAYANNLAICKEIYRYQNGDREFSMPITFLALIDGTVDLMTQKLADDSAVLNRISEHAKSTCGEIALKNAAERLRVENVAFLLSSGARPQNPEHWSKFMIEWRYRQTHKEEHQAVQKLLSDYGVLQLQVSL